MRKKTDQLFDPTPLRVVLAEQGLSPTSGAKKAKVSDVTFRRIRNGQGNVTLNKLNEAAKRLGLRVNVTLERAA